MAWTSAKAHFSTPPTAIIRISLPNTKSPAGTLTPPFRITISDHDLKSRTQSGSLVTSISGPLLASGEAAIAVAMCDLPIPGESAT
jgi:hypothetical protein